MAIRHSILGGLAALLLAGGVAAQTTTEPIDPTIPQEERICEIEIAEVTDMRNEAEVELEPMQQNQLDRLMGEAQAFCDDDNGVMAAIRLEAARAIIEVARPPAPPGGEMLEDSAPSD